jgi:ubiquinone/menaquinone biosynthesis C-methylase UbiE
MDKKFEQNLIDKTRQDYNKIATQFSSTRKYQWEDVKQAVKELGLKKGDKILDLGCGNGRLLQVLKGYQIDYTGLDISKDLVEIAQDIYPKEKFIVSDLVKMPFKDNQFDSVISIATLHHLPGTKRKDALIEINRILKPDGRILLTVWYFWKKPEFLLKIISESIKKVIGRSKLDFGDFYRDWKDSKGKVITTRYFHAWTKKEFRKLLSETGFTNFKAASLEKVEEKRNLIVIAKK